MSVGLIVVAAGSGTRLAAGVPKAFASVAGRAILQHAIENALASVPWDDVVTVAPSEFLDAARGMSLGATVVAGGATRQQSVAAGLKALSTVDVVLIHDAARPFTPPEQFQRVALAVTARGTGVIPVLPVADTLKRMDGERVAETVDRSVLAAVQTPQGFPGAALIAAYASAVEEYTDDAALFAAAGHHVTTVPGDELAFKITTPADLEHAGRLFAAEPRTGVGYDVHAYDASVPLWLGGLEWPGEPGLRGHSDGDAVIHAIVDALLSAAGLGDLGSRFGTDRPEYAGARSEAFLRETLVLVADAGYRVGNVAVQVVGAHPKIAPRREELQTRLSEMLGAPVAVSATTSDGLGFTGAEGLGALATALLIPWKQ